MPTVVTLISTGSGSVTVPSGVVSALVECWGAGGRNGGAYAYRTITTTPGEVINYSIGEGGVGTAYGSATSGQNTTFASGGREVTAQGGKASPTSGGDRSTWTAGDGGYVGGGSYGANGGGGSAGPNGAGSNASGNNGGEGNAYNTASNASGAGVSDERGGSGGSYYVYTNYSGGVPGGGYARGDSFSTAYGGRGQIRITWETPTVVTGTANKTLGAATCQAQGTVTVTGRAYSATATTTTATNLVLFSKQAQNAAWEGVAATKTNVSTVDPEGNTGTVARFTASSNVNGRAQILYPSAIGRAHNSSVYIRNVDSTQSQLAIYDGASAFAWRIRAAWSGATLTSLTSFSGTPNNITLTDEGGGWYRISASSNAISATTYMLISPDVSTGTKSVELWGAQSTRGATLHPLIETFSLPVSIGTGVTTSSGSGSVVVQGSLNATTRQAAGSASGTVSVTGIADGQMLPVTLEGVGSVQLVGSADKMLDAASLSSAGSVGVSGGLDVMLAPATLTGSGSIEITGQAEALLDSATGWATGSVEVAGRAEQSLSALTGASSGYVLVQGLASVVLSPVIGSAMGEVQSLIILSPTPERTMSNAAESRVLSSPFEGRLVQSATECRRVNSQTEPRTVAGL